MNSELRCPSLELQIPSPPGHLHPMPSSPPPAPTLAPRPTALCLAASLSPPTAHDLVVLTLTNFPQFLLGHLEIPPPSHPGIPLPLHTEPHPRDIPPCESVTLWPALL